ncbi:MAG: RT0821/Lpp0805 family surface protein [Syntrophotaleaceae bacterium]
MTRTALISALVTVTLLWAGSALAQLATMEQQAMSDTFQYALENNPTNQAADWVNPDTDRAGAVVPVRTFSDSRGRPCREFITTISIGGEQQQGYGTACRQPDGTWQIVDDRQPATTTVVKRPAYVYRPAERYYVYPHAYYNPYPIYFSFSWLFHDGRLHVGNYYPAPAWRHHRPARVRPHLYAPLPHRQWYRHQHIHRLATPGQTILEQPDLHHDNRPGRRR